MKEKMDALGVECQVHTGIRKGGPDHTRLTMDFVKRHFQDEVAGLTVSPAVRSRA